MNRSTWLRKWPRFSQESCLADPHDRRWFLPRLETLEDRTLPAGHTLATATLLLFNPSQGAQALDFLATPDQVDIYQVNLQAGDSVTVQA